MLTDANGVPLVVWTGSANQRDDGELEELLEAFPVPTDGGVAWTVHVQPETLLGDRGYGFAYLIALVGLFGIASRLSPRGKDKPHGSGVGRSAKSLSGRKSLARLTQRGNPARPT